MLLDLAFVGVFGAAGAVARYLCYLAGKSVSTSMQFPLVTLLINLSGCFLAGIVMAIVERAVPYQRHLYLMGAIGFLGSFTTFSTFSFETLKLMRDGQSGLAVLSVVTNVVLGVSGVWLGRLLAS